jgi:hypothetical protein
MFGTIRDAMEARFGYVSAAASEHTAPLVMLFGGQRTTTLDDCWWALFKRSERETLLSWAKAERYSEESRKAAGAREARLVLTFVLIRPGLRNL